MSTHELSCPIRDETLWQAHTKLPAEFNYTRTFQFEELMTNSPRKQDEPWT